MFLDEPGLMPIVQPRTNREISYVNEPPAETLARFAMRNICC
jgi:hypothetical protein